MRSYSFYAHAQFECMMAVQRDSNVNGEDAVFHKWHSSGTDNARATLTHIDGRGRTMAQPLRYQPGPHTLISQHISQSGSEKDIGERLKATAVHAHSHRLRGSRHIRVTSAKLECRKQQMEPETNGVPAQPRFRVSGWHRAGTPHSPTRRMRTPRFINN